MGVPQAMLWLQTTNFFLSRFSDLCIFKVCFRSCPLPVKFTYFIVEQNYSQFRETIGCKVHSPSKAENRPFERCSRYQQIPVRPSSQRQDHSGIIQCLIRAHLHNCVHA